MWGTHSVWWLKIAKNRSRSLGSAYPNHEKRDWGPKRAPLGMTRCGWWAVGGRAKGLDKREQRSEGCGTAKAMP